MAQKRSQLNVFEGASAVKDFLCPDCQPYVPLVELPEECNPYAKNGVRIFAKMLNFLPLQNVKSLPALQMLDEAKISGRLDGVHTLIENSSGNTVFSLATIARHYGIKRTKAIVSHEVSLGKLDILRFFGTQITVNEEPICPDPEDVHSGIYKARRAGTRKGWFNPGQYDNRANPSAHERWSGPQIWEQTRGRITVFCAGLGTTGTMVGIGGYLKKQSNNVTTVGVVRAANNPVPGVRTQGLLRQIAFDWRSVTDYVEEVGTVASYSESLKLCRLGIIAGPSAGFALSGLLNFIAKEQAARQLDRLRNIDGEVIAVFVCPDSPLPYLSDYFTYLDTSYFPPIEREHLLINKRLAAPRSCAIPEVTRGREIDPLKALKRIYTPSSILKKTYSLKKNVRIIDVRSSVDFDHAHVPGSERMDFAKLSNVSTKDIHRLRGNEVFLICTEGRRTKFLAAILAEKGLQAVSIRGGMIEWSRLNLVRKVSASCRMIRKTL